MRSDYPQYFFQRLTSIPVRIGTSSHPQLIRAAVLGSVGGAVGNWLVLQVLPSAAESGSFCPDSP